MRFAERAAWLAGFLCLVSPSPAFASPDYSLTQDKKPQPVTWQQPAMANYVIDTHGKDTANVQANASLAFALQDDPTKRQLSIGPSATVNRNTQSDAKQNNLEIGGKLTIGYRPPGILPAASVHKPASAPNAAVDTSAQLDVAFARTLAYADLSSAVCTNTPSLPQCKTQRKESIRTTVSASPYWYVLEDNLKLSGKQVFAFSMGPSIDLAYDHLIDNKINTKTGSWRREDIFQPHHHSP